MFQAEIESIPMSPLFLFLLILTGAVALVVKFLIPMCERRERAEHEHTLAVIKAVYLLKDKVKPGCYTFRWDDGRLLEPEHEKHERNKVLFQFVAGDLVSDKVQAMPTDFQRQLLELIHAGMRWKEH
jgi:hypothetical protein